MSLTSISSKNQDTSLPELRYVVDGMDCASCVKKIEAIVSRLPGTEEVKTNFSRQTLQLRLDECLTSKEVLEKNLRDLGYVPHLQVTEDELSDESELTDLDAESTVSPKVEAKKPWYKTSQGQLVVRLGGLFLIAWFLSSFVSERLGLWLFVIPTVVGVWPLAQRAQASARLGEPFSINMLVTLASIGALLIGESKEAAAVVFFFAVGELLERIAAGRARAGIQSLVALTPKTALLVQDGQTKEVAAQQLKIDQVVQINPGSRVPADGVILTGTSGLDESSITGESVPVEKIEGERVFAGSINTDGLLTVKVDRAPSDNTIARIIHMVEDAEANRAKTARFIDRFSRWYTPMVVMAAIMVAIVPSLFFGQPLLPWIYKGITLLLIGCPCALVLSVPAAITSGISAGTRHGLLVKGGAALEQLSRVTTIAFDKTGTLTAGQPQVTDVYAPDLPQKEVLRLAGAVESGSSHPLAKAIVGFAQAQEVRIPMAENARAQAGKGVSATVEGRSLVVSSPRAVAGWSALPEVWEQAIHEFEEMGKTVVILHEQGTPLGAIAIRDEAREDAKTAIMQLNRLGLRILMLTGDHERTGQAIGQQLGLEVRANLLPEDKLNAIDELKASGGVAMIGDGINDAPALAHADVGIAMGGGTDVALETADAALLHERVAGVSEMVQLSRKTMQNIQQNITVALGLKAIFLVTTLLGFTNLWMAILADTGATIMVTANALRLLSWRPRAYWRPLKEEVATK